MLSSLHLLAGQDRPFPACLRPRPHPAKRQKHTCCGRSQALPVHPHRLPRNPSTKNGSQKNRLSSGFLSGPKKTSWNCVPRFLVSFNSALYVQCDENEKKGSAFFYFFQMWATTQPQLFFFFPNSTVARARAGSAKRNKTRPRGLSKPQPLSQSENKRLRLFLFDTRERFVMKFPIYMMKTEAKPT